MDLHQKTINDFSDQWGRYKRDDGFYASGDYFKDILDPLMEPSDFAGRSVLEIGSGTGRITRMLLDAGAAQVKAVEPAAGAFATLKQNTSDLQEKIEYLNFRGDTFPQDIQADDAISIGVIHHIAEPNATMERVYQALRPGGRCLIWLYGKEGNETYLRFAEPLRHLTVKLPHFLLSGICHLLNIFLDAYIFLCRFIPLPMRDYARGVLARMARDKRYLIIYDQLNPAYAKYYTKAEAVTLLRDAGFSRVMTHHRHGYSWTVLGYKE